MTIKNAALLALTGMVLLTVLMSADFIITVSGVLHGIIPAMTLLMSLIHLFASIAVTVFFWVFHRTPGVISRTVCRCPVIHSATQWRYSRGREHMRLALLILTLGSLPPQSKNSSPKSSAIMSPPAQS